MVHLESNTGHSTSIKNDKPIETIQLLLIGDEGVGKTSLVYSLVNEKHVDPMPARMQDITIPANITPANVTMKIVDYSSKEQSQSELESLICSSHVICIVYEAHSDGSLDRIATKWIPFVRRSLIGSSDDYKRIILAANKVDLKMQLSACDRVAGILHEFEEVEACIDTSALNAKNVPELFATAQKAFIYPLAPLIDISLKALTKKCRDALIDIYAQCDIDQDGLLNDHELNLFQENCFGTPLQRDALEDLKSVIKQSTNDGIMQDCLTETGFLFLHALSIDKGRHEFTWTVLGKFGYDKQLNCSNTKEKDIKFQYEETLDREQVNTPISLASTHDETLCPSIDSCATSEDQRESIRDIGSQHSWTKTHNGLIKAGLTLTIATLVSMVALKYIGQGVTRSIT